MLEDKIWGTIAITLGLWEATALTTRKVPTITRTCTSAHVRYRHRAEAVIGVWLIGLGWHLLKGRDVEVIRR